MAEIGVVLEKLGQVSLFDDLTGAASLFGVFGNFAVQLPCREPLYAHVKPVQRLRDAGHLLWTARDPLRNRWPTTDTHAFTERVFALSYLLGSFMPRLRDLADQHLYKPV
jgi:hypothetical protein